MTHTPKPEKHDRLYGVEGADYLEGDPEYVTEVEELAPGESVIVQEWTVTDSRSHLCSVDSVMEHIADTLDTVVEGACDRYERASHIPEVRAAFESAIATFIDYAGWQQADVHIKSHRLTCTSEYTYDYLEVPV